MVDKIAVIGATLLTLATLLLPVVITAFAGERKVCTRETLKAELGWLAALAAANIGLEKILRWKPDQAVLPFLFLLVAGCVYFLRQSWRK